MRAIYEVINSTTTSPIETEISLPYPFIYIDPQHLHPPTPASGASMALHSKDDKRSTKKRGLSKALRAYHKLCAARAFIALVV